MQLPAKLVFLSPGRPNPEPACSWSPLAADFLHWSSDYGFILRQPLSKVNGRQAQQLVKAWVRCDIAAIPALQQFVGNIHVSNHDTTQLTVDEIPNLEHWAFPQHGGKAESFLTWRPSSIRNYLRVKSIMPLFPPRRIGGHYGTLIRRYAWQSFWNSPIPHEARTPWWRLLIDKLPHRARLHRWQPDKFPTSECQICQDSVEDDFHLLIGCRQKWPIWIMAYKELRIGSQPPTPESVWSTILLQNPAISKSPQYQRIMTSLGLIIAAIWQHHWHSVIEGIPWSAQACLSTIRKRRPIATVTTRKKDELEVDASHDHVC
jgi:hypothetical protein